MAARARAAGVALVARLSGTLLAMTARQPVPAFVPIPLAMRMSIPQTTLTIRATASTSTNTDPDTERPTHPVVNRGRVRVGLAEQRRHGVAQVEPAHAVDEGAAPRREAQRVVVVVLVLKLGALALN
jgi:hypothetical protein